MQIAARSFEDGRKAFNGTCRAVSNWLRRGSAFQSVVRHNDEAYEETGTDGSPDLQSQFG